MANIKALKPKYLKVSKMSVLSNWSVRYLLDTSFSYNNKYDLVRIGEFLKRNRSTIEIKDEAKYKRVTIKLNNGGVHLRDVELGKNIGTKKQYEVEPGQFILSKIDARNGAFGVIPEGLRGAVVTNDFPSFSVYNDRISNQFLVLITTTKRFINFSKSCSSGTTNRQRIDLNLFLEQKIPVPSLEEQNKIISKYNSIIELAQKQDEEANKLEQNIENHIYSSLGIKRVKSKKKDKQIQTISFNDIERWSYDYISKFSDLYELFEGHYPLVQLKNFMLSYQYGLSEKASKEPYGIPMLRMNNILNSDLITNNLKYLRKNLELIKEKYALKKGDLLFNRTNSKELVGKTAIFDRDKEYTFASYLIRVVLDTDKVNVHYINYLFNSSILQYQKDLVSRRITGQANINSKEMQDFAFPLPPIPIQNQIAETIKEIKYQVEELRKKAEENRKTAIKEFELEVFTNE